MTSRPRRLCLLMATGMACLLLIGSTAGRSGTSSPRHLKQAISYHRAQAWHWADLMGVRRHRTSYQERIANTVYLRYLVNTWRARHFELRLKARRVPNLSFWMCVHRREGSWRDPHAPYYGGLQMGHWFMRTYGWNLLQRKGTADHWTPLEQLWVAARAWKREGYSIGWLYGQWPNTAPPCR